MLISFSPRIGYFEKMTVKQKKYQVINWYDSKRIFDHLSICSEYFRLTWISRWLPKKVLQKYDILHRRQKRQRQSFRNLMDTRKKGNVTPDSRHNGDSEEYSRNLGFVISKNK